MTSSSPARDLFRLQGVLCHGEERQRIGKAPEQVGFPGAAAKALPTIRSAALGFGQIALAHEADIHPNVVGRLERGEYNPTVSLLQLLVKPLGVALSELMAGAEKRCGS